jgi:hypothetical protein
MTPIERTVVGVDVGGMKKGFHAVALRDNQIVAKLTTCSALEVAAWCRQQGEQPSASMRHASGAPPDGPGLASGS